MNAIGNLENTSKTPVQLPKVKNVCRLSLLAATQKKIELPQVDLIQAKKEIRWLRIPMRNYLTYWFECRRFDHSIHTYSSFVKQQPKSITLLEDERQRKFRF